MQVNLSVNVINSFNSHTLERTQQAAQTTKGSTKTTAYSAQR